MLNKRFLKIHFPFFQISKSFKTLIFKCDKSVLRSRNFIYREISVCEMIK